MKKGKGKNIKEFPIMDRGDDLGKFMFNYVIMSKHIYLIKILDEKKRLNNNISH